MPSQAHGNRRTPRTLNCIRGVLLTKEEGAVAQNRTFPFYHVIIAATACNFPSVGEIILIVSNYL